MQLRQRTGRKSDPAPGRRNDRTGASRPLAPALGTTFMAGALAAHASGLTLPWQRLLGLAGGAVLIAAGTANLAIADGSSLVFIAMPGYLAWLIWLLATGVRLVRARTTGRPEVE